MSHLTFRRSLGILLCLFASGAALGGYIDPFHVTITPDIRSAYVSRGRVNEDRPIQTIRARVAADLWKCGQIGFWNWNVSSLTERRQHIHQRAFNEVHLAVFYRYDWQIMEKLKLTTELTRMWLVFNGFSTEQRAKGSDATVHEWRIEQSLENPYLTPYYLMRRGVCPQDWVYFMVGVRRRFTLTETLSLKPYVFADLGDSRHFEQRYGTALDGETYPYGFQAVHVGVEVTWKALDWMDVFASVEQFDLVSGMARDKVDTNDRTRDSKDLTILTAGLRFRF